MKGIRKPFSQEEYDRSDAFGKDAVAGFLEQELYIEVRVPVENYGPDIEVYWQDNLIAYHEVEVRRNWKSDQEDFPYSTIHIPARKSRLIELAKKEGAKLYFWSVREDGMKAMFVDSDDVTEDRLVEVPNKRVWKGEYFYDIPSELYFKIILRGNHE